jgi:hypothetical protein
MIINITIKAPFWHRFKGRDTFYTTQDMMRIDTSKPEGVEEFKYIISNNYPYKNFIHINENQVERFLNRHVKTEDDYNIYSNVNSPESFLKSPEYIGDNPFVNPVRHQPSKQDQEQSESIKAKEGQEKQTQQGDFEQQPSQENLNASNQEEIIEDSHLKEEKQQEEQEEHTNVTSDTNPKEEKQKRRLELENSHYTKVKSIAEEDYGLSYTNKLETIESILDKEFPNVE